MKLKETLIEIKIVEDLDMEYPYYDGDIQNEITRDGFDSPVGCSISIEQLQSILDDFKFKGVNRVYISSEFDHHGYTFYGVEIK